MSKQGSSESGKRLNRFLASTGMASRRACDEYIRAGRVTINREVVTDLSARVWEDDEVRVDSGKPLETKISRVIRIYKPRGCVTTKNDEHGRPTVISLLPPQLQHLNHVGRLDQDSEGLLIMTNDGDLAQKLTHPKTKIQKEYLVTLDQAFDNDKLGLLLHGIRTPDGFLQAEAIMRVSPRRVRVILTTGLKRQLRVMFKTLGLRVKKLVRIRIGSLYLGDLPLGKWEYMDDTDLSFLEKNPPLEKKFIDLKRLQTLQKKRPSQRTAKKVARKSTGKRKTAQKKRGPNTGTRGKKR